MMVVLKHMCIYFKWNLVTVKYLLLLLLLTRFSVQLTTKVYPCCSYQIATAEKDLVV